MNKVAAVLMSFSWIFMVIVGSFFIIFAYNIISTYQDNEEVKQDLEFGLSLQSIFKKVGYGKGSETTSLEKINYIFENSNIELLCAEGFPILSVNGQLKGGNDQGSYLKNYPFFMTTIEQDKKDETYIAVEQFDFPFYITPLMALVSERNLYVFDQDIWDSTFKEKFSRTSAFKSLNTRAFAFRNSDGTPNSIEIDALFNEIKDLDLSSVTFVSSETNSLIIPLPSSMSEVQRINIEITQTKKTEPSGNSILEYTTGEITYKDASYWNGADLSSEYTFNYSDFEDSMSLPTFAIFSTPESFECGLQTVNKLINSTYTYYIEKSEVLKNEVTNNFQVGKYCSNSNSNTSTIAYYDKLKNNLEEIKNDQERFKNIDNLNNLLVQLWKSKEEIDSNNCIDVY
jgi:hypothetical protein